MEVKQDLGVEVTDKGQTEAKAGQGAGATHKLKGEDDHLWHTAHPILPIPDRFVLNITRDYIPMMITDRQGHQTPTKYVQVHRTGHPYIIGCLLACSPWYQGDIHAAPCHDMDHCPTYTIQQL
jgi:hypothetical protein